MGGLSAALGESAAASKRGASFGGKVHGSSLAALSLLAVDCPDIINEKNPPQAQYPFPVFAPAKVPLATHRPLYPFGNELPQSDFQLPHSLQLEDADSNPLDINRPCSPGLEMGVNDLDELSHLLDLPDDDQLNDVDNCIDLPDEIDKMIDLPDDTLFDSFMFDNGEMFQNGLGADMVSRGRYFRPVVHAARRRVAFLASNLWSGPSPALHGLPYSYAHWRKGSRHHFAEVFVSTSIVARELKYSSPVQYVGARGWTLSSNRKLHYRQIDEIIFRNAPASVGEMHKNFKGIVTRLYEMIEKDGLKDPFTDKPAVNFLERDSFVQKLHGNAQEFQMAVILVKTFFMEHADHHKDNVEYWLKEIFRSCRKRKDLLVFYNSLFSLFSNGEDPKLAKELLKHPDAMRDEVCRRANAIEHKIRYSKLVESGLQTMTRKTAVGTMPSATSHLLLARARARDWARSLMTEDQKILIPSSTIQAERKAKSSAKRNNAGVFLFLTVLLSFLKTLMPLFHLFLVSLV